MFGPKTQLIAPMVHVVVQIGLTGPLTDFPSNWKLIVGAFSSFHIHKDYFCNILTTWTIYEINLYIFGFSHYYFYLSFVYVDAADNDVD